MSRKNLRPWETISRETILNYGRFLKVERHAVRLPDGRVIPDWTWVSLGSHVLDPNRGVATMHLFLALGARPVAEPDSDDLEDQELLLLSRAEMERALREGAFKVVAWSAVVAMAQNHFHFTEGGMEHG